MPSALCAALASLCAAITTLRARGVKRLKPCSASRSVVSLGTKRFWAACRVTPILLPISVQVGTGTPGLVHEVADEVVGDLPQVLAGDDGVLELFERLGVHLLDGRDQVVEAYG
ncbi:hypothetical protein SFUMM280S_02999 [Streptomyces fumanus]